MSYYTIAEDTGQILEVHYVKCPDVQKEANTFKCAVYIIKGEHTGLSARPSPTTPPPPPDAETG